MAITVDMYDIVRSYDVESNSVITTCNYSTVNRWKMLRQKYQPLLLMRIGLLISKSIRERDDGNRIWQTVWQLHAGTAGWRPSLSAAPRPVGSRVTPLPLRAWRTCF